MLVSCYPVSKVSSQHSQSASIPRTTWPLKVTAPCIMVAATGNDKKRALHTRALVECAPFNTVHEERLLFILYSVLYFIIWGEIIGRLLPCQISIVSFCFSSFVLCGTAAHLAATIDIYLLPLNSSLIMVYLSKQYPPTSLNKVISSMY